MTRKFFTLLTLLILTLNIAGQQLTEHIPGSEVSFDMVLLPGGTFSMVDTSQDQTDEIPVRKIYLDSFWIGVYEVKYDEFIIFYQKEYDTDESENSVISFSADAVSRPTPQYIDYTYGMGKAGFPAVSMTQQAALRYCKWLYEKTGKFFRLPTEAEWEYACLSGQMSDYPSTNTDLSDYAWFYENGFEKYHEVGHKQPNDIGLYDMLGNVTEWTLDQYQEDYFQNLKDGAKNPWVEPERRHSRTVKGGSYDSDAEDCSCRARHKSSPSWQARDPQIPKSKWWNPDSPFVGFRIVRPVKEMSHEEIEAFFQKAIKD